METKVPTAFPAPPRLEAPPAPPRIEVPPIPQRSCEEGVLKSVTVVRIEEAKAGPRFWQRNRTLILFVVFLLAADWLIGQFASLWQDHSPDDYAIRVENCAKERRDVVFVGGSPVAEGIDPDRIAGIPWRDQPLTSVYALGLSGGTTSDFYHAVLHGCPKPPRLLVYGITASDLNDSRHEPHGPYSLMTPGDVAGWVRLRPEAGEWVLRHYAYAKLGQASNLYRYRHGMRLWAACQVDERFPGSSPETMREADELRERAKKLRTGNGYAPARGFASGNYAAVKAAGLAPKSFPYLAKFRTGSHLKYLHRLIDWCEAGGTELLLVDMPVTADLEAMYPAEFAEFRQRVVEIGRDRQIRVIHATREALGVTDGHFADLIHLNRDGARVLSDWLASRLKMGLGE